MTCGTDQPRGALFALAALLVVGRHPMLVAQTRLGEQSVAVIPIFPEDGYRPETTPDFAQAKVWFLRTVNLSRKGVVKKFQAMGVPEGWKKSPLLRNAFPLLLLALDSCFCGFIGRVLVASGWECGNGDCST